MSIHLFLLLECLGRGTTMIEKVLGNCDEVDEMGELVTMDRLITNRKAEGINWPYNISKLNKLDLEDIGKKYINVVKEINPKIKKALPIKCHQILYILGY